LLGNSVDGDGLACARRAGNQTMAIGHFRQQELISLAFGDKQRVGHEYRLLK
jgi:hypothetical protein